MMFKCIVHKIFAIVAHIYQLGNISAGGGLFLQSHQGSWIPHDAEKRFFFLNVVPSTPTIPVLN